MISLDPRSGRSPSEQLTSDVASRIRSGEFAVGTRLPSVRRLATELRLAPGTVAKAYAHLEQAGLVEGRGRAGTFVTADTDGTRQFAARAATEFADRTRALGMSDDELLAVVRAALEAPYVG